MNGDDQKSTDNTSGRVTSTEYNPKEPQNLKESDGTSAVSKTTKLFKRKEAQQPVGENKQTKTKQFEWKQGKTGDKENKKWKNKSLIRKRKSDPAITDISDSMSNSLKIISPEKAGSPKGETKDDASKMFVSEESSIDVERTEVIPKAVKQRKSKSISVVKPKAEKRVSSKNKLGLRITNDDSNYLQAESEETIAVSEANFIKTETITETVREVVGGKMETKTEMVKKKCVSEEKTGLETDFQGTETKAETTKKKKSRLSLNVSPKSAKSKFKECSSQSKLSTFIQFRRSNGNPENQNDSKSSVAEDIEEQMSDFKVSSNLFKSPKSRKRNDKLITRNINIEEHTLEDTEEIFSKIEHPVEVVAEEEILDSKNEIDFDFEETSTKNTSNDNTTEEITATELNTKNSVSGIENVKQISSKGILEDDTDSSASEEIIATKLKAKIGDLVIGNFEEISSKNILQYDDQNTEKGHIDEDSTDEKSIHEECTNKENIDEDFVEASTIKKSIVAESSAKKSTSKKNLKIPDKNIVAKETSSEDRKPNTSNESNSELLNMEEENVKNEGRTEDSKEKINAFQFMMNRRHKVIGSNSPGKEELRDSSLDTKPDGRKLASRKEKFKEWNDKKGGTKRKLIDEEREEYIDHALDKRAKRMKKLLRVEDDKTEVKKRKRKRVSRLKSSSESDSNAVCDESSNESIDLLKKKSDLLADQRSPKIQSGLLHFFDVLNKNNSTDKNEQLASQSSSKIRRKLSLRKSIHSSEDELESLVVLNSKKRRIVKDVSSQKLQDSVLSKNKKNVGSKHMSEKNERLVVLKNKNSKEIDVVVQSKKKKKVSMKKKKSSINKIVDCDNDNLASGKEEVKDVPSINFGLLKNKLSAKLKINSDEDLVNLNDNLCTKNELKLTSKESEDEDFVNENPKSPAEESKEDFVDIKKNLNKNLKPASMKSIAECSKNELGEETEQVYGESEDEYFVNMKKNTNRNSETSSNKLEVSNVKSVKKKQSTKLKSDSLNIKQKESKNKTLKVNSDESSDEDFESKKSELRRKRKSASNKSEDENSKSDHSIEIVLNSFSKMAASNKSKVSQSKSGNRKSISKRSKDEDFESDRLVEIVEDTTPEPRRSSRVRTTRNYFEEGPSEDGKKSTEDSVSSKSKKVAPIFLKMLPKPKIDPVIVKARFDFLHSGVPDSLKKMIEKQQNSIEDIEYDIFPTVSHVQQIPSQPSDLWNLPRVPLNFRDEDEYKFKPDLTSFKSITNSKTTESLQKIDFDPPDKRLPFKTILEEIKNSDPGFPVYKTFKAMCEQNGINFEKPNSPVKKKRGRPRKTVEPEVCKPAEINTREYAMWTDKYRPKSSDEVLGNRRSVGKLKKWLQNWIEFSQEIRVSKRSRGDSSDFESTDESSRGSTRAPQKAIILKGPLGSGKTIAVYAVCQDLNINVLELNASSKRTGKKLLQELQEATQSHQVHQNETNAFTSYFRKENLPRDTLDSDNGDKKMCLLLIEDVDIVYEQDEGFISALMQLLLTSKRPVVMTTSNVECGHVDKLISQHSVLSFTALSTKMIDTWLQILCLSEGLNVGSTAIGELLEWNKSDVRRTLLQLQFWVQSGGDPQGSTSAASFFESKIPDRTKDVCETDISSSFLENIEDSVVPKLHTNCVNTFVACQRLPCPLNLGVIWWNLPDILNFDRVRHSKAPVRTKTIETKDSVENVFNVLDVLSLSDALNKTEGVDVDVEPCSKVRECCLREGSSLVENFYDYKSDRVLLHELTHSLVEGYCNISNADFDRCVNMAVPTSSEIRWRKKRHECEAEYFKALAWSSSVDRLSFAVDYFPMLRHITRTEASRCANNRKRGNRFHNYLRTLSINPGGATLETARSMFLAETAES